MINLPVEVVAELLGAFAPNAQRDLVEKMPLDDPRRDPVLRLGDTVTLGVGHLRSVFPNPRINALMRLVWDIIGHRVVPVAMGPNVPSLTVGVVNTQAVIFTPHNWLDMVAADPFYQLGALVFVGSQAMDFFTGRVKVQSDVHALQQRALAHEAEYLLTATRLGAPLNTYQRQVLEEFPQGLDTPTVRALVYEPPPFLRH